MGPLQACRVPEFLTKPDLSLHGVVGLSRKFHRSMLGDEASPMNEAEFHARIRELLKSSALPRTLPPTRLLEPGRPADGIEPDPSRARRRRNLYRMWGDGSRHHVPESCLSRGAPPRHVEFDLGRGAATGLIGPVPSVLERQQRRPQQILVRIVQRDPPFELGPAPTDND